MMSGPPPRNLVPISAAAIPSIDCKDREEFTKDSGFRVDSAEAIPEPRCFPHVVLSARTALASPFRPCRPYGICRYRRGFARRLTFTARDPLPAPGEGPKGWGSLLTRGWVRSPHVPAAVAPVTVAFFVFVFVFVFVFIFFVALARHNVPLLRPRVAGGVALAACLSWVS